METNQEKVSEDWAAECSDDEKYRVGPDDLIELYTKIANGEILELEWKCPGRRSPTPEPATVNVEIEEETNGESVTEEKTALPEFDFDESSSVSGGVITPRRPSVGGTKTPRSNQKKVASLDKIMNDMRRHRKMDEELRKTSSGKTDSNPSSSPRLANSKRVPPKAT